MALEMWSNLPTDILLIIAKILNSDVDIIHLRSVCSSWRSSVRRRYKPSSFPLEVPPLFANRSFALRIGSHYFLNYSTLYRLSPPEFGPYAGDPSDGYLLRVSEVKPNSFSLLTPLIPEKTNFHPDLVPKHLNLLDFRISEICKCYSFSSVDATQSEEAMLSIIVTKVIVLWNYAVDRDFAVLILFKQGYLYYWKFGDEDWLSIDSKSCRFSDVVLFDGKCYGISCQGVLHFIDSDFNLKVAPLPPLPVDWCKPYKYDFYLVEYKSDLYVVSKFYDEAKVNPDEDDSTDEDDGSDEEGINEIPLELKIFKKCNDWESIGCLGDEVFLLCQDVSVGLSAKDFRGCKGNCVYLSPKQLLPYRHDKKIQYGVHDLDDHRTSIMKMDQGCALCRPPPKWLNVQAIRIDSLRTSLLILLF